MPRITKKTTAKKSVSPKRRSRKPAVLKTVALSGGPVAHGHVSVPHHHHAQSQTDDKNKRLVMWLGVSVVMAVVVGIWITNLNRILGAGEIFPRTNEQEKLDFASIKSELSNTLSEVKNDMKNLEMPTSATPTATTSPSVTPTVNPALPNTLPN